MRPRNNRNYQKSDFMDGHNLCDFEGVEKVAPSYPGNIKKSLSEKNTPKPSKFTLLLCHLISCSLHSLSKNFST